MAGVIRPARCAITDHYGVPLSDFRVVSSCDQIIQRVRSLGERTRGIVFGARPDVGHVFNVVFDKNGVVFLDGQSGGSPNWRTSPSCGY